MPTRSPFRLPSVAMVLLGVVVLLSNVGAACGRPSAADRDPVVKNGKRVQDNGVEDFSYLDDPPADAPPQMGPPGNAAPATPPLPRLLVAGDSVAYELSFPIVNRQRDLGVAAHTQADQGCGLVKVDRVRHDDGSVEATGATCRWPESWVPAELQTNRPDIVLLAQGTPRVQYDVAGAWLGPCDEGFEGWYAARFAEVVDQMTTFDAFVAVVSSAHSVPPLPVGIGTDPTECFNRALTKAVAERTDAAIVDLDGWACPNKVCVAKDGVVLWTQTGELTKDGAEVVARWLVPNALRAAGFSD